jgi:hypothetical protein
VGACVIGPLRRILGAPNRAARHDGHPFEPQSAFGPPSGVRWNWCHYGVMVPGLPSPHRAFNVMAIVGTPGVSLFANDWAIRTTPRDTAYVVSATSSMTEHAFAAYSIAQDCSLAPDGSALRFGSDLAIEGQYPYFVVHRENGDVVVDLTISASETVTWFVDIPGVYEHWSLLCDYTGRIVQDATVTPISGLCTLEYARGSGPHALPRALAAHATLPARRFTYQVLNLDAENQLLLTEVLGPLGIPILRTAYVRDRTGSTRFGTARFTVSSHFDQARSTPDGRAMRLAREFSWDVRDEAGRPVVELNGTAADDWAYGLGAGFTGSFDYAGCVRGRSVRGVGYIEYIDLG